MADAAEWERMAAEGWSLRERPDDMLSFFRSKAKTFPNSARAHFELANVLDHLGREQEAIPEYQEALALGLEHPFDLYALLQLGSSFRNVGQVEQALRSLELAREIDPDGSAGVLFSCLALHSAGRESRALALALTFILDHADGITRERYGEALRRYIAALDQDAGRSAP